MTSVTIKDPPRDVPEGRRTAASRDVRPARSYDTAELFGGETEIEITHQQSTYRLKITRQGKLILNK